jgi:cysteine desulfurase
MKEIYLDNSASTPIDPRVLRVMNEAYKKYGNPSSFNDAGRLARAEMESARLTIARFLGARPEEIIFTGSGSEANNIALQGTLSKKKGTVLTTPTEHLSVLETLKKIEGVKVAYVPVDKQGLVDLRVVEKMLTAHCSLVSIMYANNEIGTLQPIQKISKIIKEYNKKLEIENWKLKTDATRRVLLHVDACQAVGFLDVNVNHLGVDLLTFNGSKINGPRGIGALYIRKGVKISTYTMGGGQERGLRAGTENVPAIVGLAKAVALINEQETRNISKLRDYAIERLEKSVPGILINGPRGHERLANNISICVPNLESENLLLELDKHGISAGSGSACTSHAVEPSHVLKAIGVPKSHISGALRFSLGRDTTKKDIDYLIKSLAKIIADLTKRYARFR